MKLRTLLVLLHLTSVTSPTWAGVTFFVDDEAGFDAAISGSLAFLAGTEDWSSSTLPDSQLAFVPDPIAPGVPNGPFPTGTNPATGMIVQSNTLGGTPSTPSPGGGLGASSAGYDGSPGDQVSNWLGQQSFDMIFMLTNTPAVSITPLVFDENGVGNPGTATIRVYDSSNVLLGSVVDIDIASFHNPTTFVGVLATAGDDIGRINVFANPSGGHHWSGADNIVVYSMDPTAVEASLSTSSWARIKVQYR